MLNSTWSTEVITDFLFGYGILSKNIDMDL